MKLMKTVMTVLGKRLHTTVGKAGSASELVCVGLV